MNENNSLPFLQARHSLRSWYYAGEDIPLHSNTKGERNDIEKEEVSGLSGGGLAREDTGLDGSTVGNSLVGVYTLLELLTIEELRQELLDLGDTSGTTNQNDLVNGRLLDCSILEDLSNGFESARESLGIEFFETGTSDSHGEVFTIEERINLNGSLGTAGQGTLGTLASSTESSQGTGIATKVLLGLARERCAAMI